MGERKVLVTGGAGYIGSYACKALKQAGFTPVTFDNLVTGWKDAVKFGPFEPGDLLNKADVDRAFKMSRVQIPRQELVNFTNPKHI